MQHILRVLFCLTVLAALLGLVACGGDEEVSSDTSVNELIDKTFAGDKKVDSGKLDITLRINVKGGGTGLQGPINVKLSGPFQSTGETSLPKFDLDVALEGSGQNIKAGATSTGDKGFVNFNGQEYAVSDDVFKQFKDGFEQAAKQGRQQNPNPSLKSLGIDPRRWLTNPKNAGEEKVGDADTVKITGSVDVPKLLDDVNNALAKAGSLGLQGQAQLPTKLTDEQKAQVAKAVQDLKVDIYTGKDDAIMRRMNVALSIKDPAGNAGEATIAFDLVLTDLNEDQEINAPTKTKPFEELLQALGGLGFGGLGGLGGGSGSGSGGSGGSGSSGASAEKLQKYTDCVEKAGNDLEKAQKCADILAP